jgi:guanosine-3',5'-bis(diphosphate) 3'-pyrophosphohydrolase
MQLPDFRTLEARLGHLTAGEIADIQRAFDFAVSAHAHQKREDGSPYVVHVIAVAEIVANWEADRDTIIAALLHDVLEDTTITKEEILTHFGRRVSLLVEGITKFTQADLSPDLPLDRKIETIRKLFDVMRLDMRSIVIKLADRLHNVLTIDSLPTPERRRRFAIETLTVYDKIAYHLGLRDVRRTFAAFCVLHAFPSGAEELRTRDQLCHENAQIPGMIAHELGRIGIGHVLSVSMQPRNLLIFHERIADKAGNVLIEDAFSVIVIVKNEDDCYRLLKSLHTLYRPVAGQFRDYIAAPSDAGYQSLHTVVTLQNGVVIEIRIRTPHMEEQVSRGITLWLFSPTAVLPPSFAWLKRSAAIDLETRDSSGAFWEALESDVLSETISVTVDRKRISLPRGATALDAAYAEHNAGAGKLLSITIGGRPVAFGEVLTEDNVLHLSFGPHERVAFDWLQMVATKHARTHIVDVLKRTSRYEKIALGAAILQKELDHYNKGLVQELSKSQTQHVAEHFRRQSFDDVLSMVGEGVVRARDVVFYLFPEHRKSLLMLPSGARYAFRLHVTGRLAKQQDAQAHVSGIARLSDTAIHRTNVSFQPSSGRVDIVLSGSADDRLQFADFVDLLERQEWTSSVQTIISLKQKAFLFIAFAFAFSVTLLDIIFFPEYQQLVTGLPFGLRFLVQSLPLFPILIANYYLLRLLRHYIARMRSDRWFLGIALVLNLVGLMVLVLRIVTLGFAQESLLPLVAVFALSLLYMAYMFFQTDALLAPFDERLLHVIPQAELSSLKRKKYTGYGIRLLAVLIWGLEPIYIRYTPVNDLSPFLRTFLLGVGVLVPSLCIFVVRHYLRERRMPKFAMPYDPIF